MLTYVVVCAQTNPHAIPFIQTEQRLCGNILQVQQLLALLLAVLLALLRMLTRLCGNILQVHQLLALEAEV